MDIMKEQLEVVSEFCMSLGINKSIRGEDGNKKISHMPVAYFPYQLKSCTYKKLVRLHQIWQRLIVKGVADANLMEKICASVSKNDEFMGKMGDIYRKSLKMQRSARVACTRIDYMGDDNPQLVEFNLWSVGLNGISDKVQELSSILATRQDAFYPPSNNQQTICKCLVDAMTRNKNTDGILIMVVHVPEFNFGDQNYFKLEMRKRGIKVQSYTMDELIKGLNFVNGNCFLMNQKKVSGFYFRTGYTPQHYPTQAHWDLYQNIELSQTVKLPSVEMIIMNTKRMQAELAKPEVIKKYLSPAQAQQIIEISGQIYDLDEITKQDLSVLLEKMKNGGYVMKPNREGGGNNVFSQEAYKTIYQLQDSPFELQKYIVMKSIPNRVENNIFVIEFAHVQFQKTCAQFSTVGSFVYEGEEIIENICGGHLVRLKDSCENEGGIAINKGAIAGLTTL